MEKVLTRVHSVRIRLYFMVIITGFLHGCNHQEPPIVYAQEPPENLQIYRTMMPDAGPSAFAVRFPEDSLALCYDPVRGGINYVWFGDFNLDPTVEGKINAPVEIAGEPFYYGTKWQPLRMTTNEEINTEYHFLGYTVLDGILVFRYIIGDRTNGLTVNESIIPIKGGIRRTFEVSRTIELNLWVESQKQAIISVEGDPVQGNEWVKFRGHPNQPVAITIQSKIKS